MLQTKAGLEHKVSVPKSTGFAQLVVIPLALL